MTLSLLEIACGRSLPRPEAGIKRQVLNPFMKEGTPLSFPFFAPTRTGFIFLSTKTWKTGYMKEKIQVDILGRTSSAWQKE